MPLTQNFVPLYHHRAKPYTGDDSVALNLSVAYGFSPVHYFCLDPVEHNGIGPSPGIDLGGIYRWGELRVTLCYQLHRMLCLLGPGESFGAADNDYALPTSGMMNFLHLKTDLRICLD